MNLKFLFLALVLASFTFLSCEKEVIKPPAEKYSAAKFAGKWISPYFYDIIEIKDEGDGVLSIHDFSDILYTRTPMCTMVTTDSFTTGILRREDPDRTLVEELRGRFFKNGDSLQISGDVYWYDHRYNDTTHREKYARYIRYHE